MTGFPIPTLETAEAVEQTDLLPIAQVNGGGKYSKARRVKVEDLMLSALFLQTGTGTKGVSLGDRFSTYIDAREENVAAGVAADQSAGLIAALTRGQNEGKEVVLPPGVIRCDQQIPILSGLRLIGRDQRAVLDFSNAGAIGAMIKGAGTLGTAHALDAQADPGDDEISAPSHGLAVGDWCRIISTIDSQSSAAGDLRLGDRADVVPFVETHEVAEVINSSTIRIRGALRFVYPVGSTVRRIAPVIRARLREISMLGGNLNLSPIHAELAQGLSLEDIRVIDAGTWSVISGCFDGTRLDRFKVRATAAGTEATNLQFLKIVDNSTGVIVSDPDMANGGQMIDVTYTPGGALVAPVLDTTIRGGLIRGSGNYSAIVDHPGCKGTSVLGVTFHDVRSAILIRSRDAVIAHNRAKGTREFAESNSFGVWLGENGYWNGATIANNFMEGFEAGYVYAGGVATIGREMLDTGNIARDCNRGLVLGSSTAAMIDVGIKSRDFRGERIAATGIDIQGTGDGVDIEGFQVRGPLINAGVQITGDLLNAKIHGEVIGIGSAIPALKVASGTPAGNDIDIRRRGDCGLNSGVTRAMVALNERVLASFCGTSTHTGNTTETTLFNDFYTIPNGAFDATARLRLRLLGSVSGAAGTKTIRLRVGASLWSPSLPLPAGANGDFVYDIEMVGLDATNQSAFARFTADGVTGDHAGPTNRNINLAGGGPLDLTVQIANAADSITINSYELIGSWA